MNARILSLVLLLVCCSCSSLKTVSYMGETVTLSVDQRELEMELLCLGDTCLYTVPASETVQKHGLQPDAVYSISYASLQGLEVENISNQDWVTGVLLMEVVPAVLMGVAAASYSGGEAFFPATAACLVPAGLSALLLGGGTAETPSLPPQATAEQREVLCRFARFPQGLTDTQLRLFLASRQQNAPLQLEQALPPLPVPSSRGNSYTGRTPNGEK